MKTARCVYCLATKDVHEFNREHVLPQAFGKYEDNLVLHDRVCKGCNDYFGKELDSPLARDSNEGLERFQHGLVRDKKPRRLIGERIRLRQRGGQLDGALLEVDLDSSGTTFLPKPARQVGFGTSEEGPFEWCRLEDLPSLETMREKNFAYVVTGGLSAEDAFALFAELGLATSHHIQLPDPRDVDGMINTTMHGVIDNTIRRAIAKVAFNYFAYHHANMAVMDQLRAVREYIRFGTPLDQNPVAILTRPILGETPLGAQILAHIITVRWHNDVRRLIAQVSFFGWLQYEITLSREGFILPPNFVDSGHAFNPFFGQVARLTHDRRKSIAMPLVSKQDFVATTKPR